MKLQYQKIIWGIIIVFFVIGGAYTYQLSQHWEQVLIGHIQKKLSHYQKTTGVKFKWEQISISFILPKIKIKKLMIHLPNYPTISKPVLAKQLIITPNYIPILVKKKLSAKVVVIQPTITINMSESVRSNQKNLLPSIENQKIPTVNILLKNLSLSLNKGKEKISTDSLNLHIKSHSSHIAIYAETPSIQISNRPAFYLQTNIMWKPNSFFIKKLSFHNAHSSFQAFGQINGILSKKRIKTGWLKINTSFKEDDFAVLSRWIHPKFQYPYQGQVTLSAHLKYQQNSRFAQDISLRHLTGNFHFSTDNFAIQNIFFSKIKAQGQITNQSIQFNTFYIHHTPKWKIRLLETFLSLKEPFSFHTNILVQNSRLHSLFQSANLKNVPVFGNVNGNWECHGQWLNHFFSSCKGPASIKDLLVRTKDDFTVLSVPSLKTTSEFKISDNIFSIHVQGQTKSSHVNFTSWLDKNKNFQAQVKATVDFTDIEDLAHLSPKGILDIKNGKINISSKGLFIQSDLITKNATIKDIHIGQAQAYLKYTNGILNFQNIKGLINHSNYRGQIGIDFFQNTINAFIHSPSFTLRNLKYALENKISWPEEWQGHGQLTAAVNGQLKANAIQYRLQSQLSDLILAKESFDSAIVHIESKNGPMKIRQLELLKKNGQISLTGQINPKGNMQLDIIGGGLLLQDSPNIIQHMGRDWLGAMDFGMSVRGTFLHPTIKANVEVKDTYFKGRSIADSNFSFQLYPDKVIAEGKLFNTIQLHRLIFPYKGKQTVTLNANIKNFNLQKFLLPASVSSRIYHSLHSQIDGDIALSYRKNQFLSSSTGHIKIDQLMLKTHSHILRNQKPFSIQLKNGRMHLDSFQLTDNNAKSIHFTHNQNINIKGDVKLNFLIFLLPFVPVLEGHLTTQMSVQPYLWNLQPTGYVKIKKGMVQLHSMLEPFESIRSNIQVQNNQWQIQSLQTKIAGGNMQAKGLLSFKKGQAALINIHGSLNQVHLKNLPGIHTTGTGTIQLTGRKMPYTLSITADMENTQIDKEFQTNNEQQIPISSFLPKNLKKQTDEPIQLQLNLQLKTPAKITNSTVKAAATGQLKITGPVSQPTLFGQLHLLPDGVIIFRDHQFKIASGIITYRHDKPQNPFINLTAKTFAQEQNKEGDFTNKYNILLRVKGQGRKASFRLTSIPALTKNEIISLLAFGSRSIPFQSASSQNIATSNIAKYSYYHLGPALFQKALNKELQHTLGVNFLSLPHMNSQKNTSSTKLILKKKIFNKVNVSTSRTILDDNPENNVKAEYEINNHTSLIGFWKNEKPLEGSDRNASIIGFDLEYQVDF